MNNGNDVETYPAGFDSNNSDNIVNRLGKRGVQVEQCVKASECYGIKIATAIADLCVP